VTKRWRWCFSADRAVWRERLDCSHLTRGSDYWYGDRVNITIDNTLTTVNGVYAGSAVNGANVEVHVTGLTVISVQADSGFVCLPVYPSSAI
jgi:hypothetical protein